MDYSKKLKLIIQISNLTQEKLADEIGVSFVTINSWINKRSAPHKKNIEKINNLYLKYTGQKSIPDNELEAKKELIKEKVKKHKNTLERIINNPDIYDSFLLALTYNSNSIEGNTLTEPETAAVIFDKAIIKNKDLIEMMEARNHKAALDYMFTYLNDGGKINEDFILNLHSKIMNSIRQDAGKYRKVSVRIAGSNIPTSNPLSVPKKMKSLISDLNRKKDDIIKYSSEIHARFEQIHPFSDGNGRVGRLLLNAMLLKNNLAPAIIKQNEKSIYYNVLNTAQSKGEYSPLDNFITDGVIEGFKMLE